MSEKNFRVLKGGKEEPEYATPEEIDQLDEVISAALLKLDPSPDCTVVIYGALQHLVKLANVIGWSQRNFMDAVEDTYDNNDEDPDGGGQPFQKTGT